MFHEFEFFEEVTKKVGEVRVVYTICIDFSKAVDKALPGGLLLKVILHGIQGKLAS